MKNFYSSSLSGFLYSLLFLSFFSCSKPDESHSSKRPNIIFFLVDDQRNDVLSCEGHPTVRTPTIDQLAREGVKFSNAFVTTSICAASRASILTGLYEKKHNYTFGKPPIKTGYAALSYPYLLRRSGYNTGFIGKFGVQLENQDSLINELFDYFEPSAQAMPHFIEMEDGSLRHSAEIKGDQAIDYINRQSPEVPFCLSVSFNAVHAVDGNKTPGGEGHYPYPKAVSKLYEGIEMNPPHLSDPSIYENHPDFLKNSLNRERFFWRWDTDEKYQVNMRAYFRMISGYDNVMKRVLSHLKERDMDKNTIVIFSADNGYYMGNRGFAGKWSHYEESLRVPLIILDPQAPMSTRGSKAEEVVLNLDIPSTILDYAGISVPDLYQGSSLLPIVEQRKPTEWRKQFFCEHRMDHPKIPKYVGVRGERYVYARYYEQDPPYEYLHDLSEDPDQLVNFSSNATYQNVLEEMRRQCDELENELL
jgi:arylsulfatase A-like enzyme